MKNKKTLVWVVTAAALVLIAAGLYFASVAGLFTGITESGDNTITFELSVTVGGEETVWSNEVETTEGTALIDVMSANITENGGVVYTESEYGAYITSICGYSENYDTNEYWLYTINGESAMVGASEYCPSDGDEVVFDLSELVW